MQGKQLSRKAYLTFKARANAERRLRALERSWNLALIWTTSGLLVVSIFVIQADDLLGDYTAASLAAGTAVVLVQSLVVGQARYGARADEMLRHFNRLQRISSSIDREVSSQSSDTNELATLEAAYHDEVARSENHTTIDYLLAVKQNPLSADDTKYFSVEHQEREAESARNRTIWIRSHVVYAPWLLPIALAVSFLWLAQ